jgi:IclR family transcriptional regulator, pca regulon regulatory protein
MARRKRPQYRLSKYWAHIAQKSVRCIALLVFLMLVSFRWAFPGGIRMAAIISRSGSGQQVPSRLASKAQAANKTGPKQRGQDGGVQGLVGGQASKGQLDAAAKNQIGGKAVSRPEIPTNSVSSALPAAASPVSAQIDEFGGDPNFMTSLARGLAVIQAFTQRQRDLTVSQISVKTGFSRAAVRRCLYTLAKLGFAATDDSRHFHLRPRVLALGHSYISSMPLAAMAQPILENVSHILHESCSIATLDRTEIVYIARANVTRIMSIDLVVGSRLPAFCTSMGRILMADLSAEKLDEFLGRVEFKRYTERTVVNAEKLRQLLRLVQRNGFSIVDQELESGLRSMAVPVRDSAGRVVAALNVGTHAQRVSIQDLQVRFLPHLKAAAEELSMVVR